MTAERDSTMTLDEVMAEMFDFINEGVRPYPDKIREWAWSVHAHLATHDAVVSDESWRPVVSNVLTALDIATGDTDPNIDPDMTDDEVRDEYPEIWAMQQLSLLLAIQPESLASRKVQTSDAVVSGFCTVCGGDCSSANPPVTWCPLTTQGIDAAIDTQEAVNAALASRKVAVPDEISGPGIVMSKQDVRDAYYAEGWNACRQAMLAQRDGGK